MPVILPMRSSPFSSRCFRPGRSFPWLPTSVTTSQGRYQALLGVTHIELGFGDHTILEAGGAHDPHLDSFAVRELVAIERHLGSRAADGDGLPARVTFRLDLDCVAN